MVRHGGKDGKKQGLANRFRRVEAATEGVDLESTTDDQLDEDTARWVDLAHAGGRLALAAATGDLGGLTEPTSALFRAVIAVEEAQARLLQSIDENVKLLRDGPFKTERLYLSEAHRLIGSPERSEEFVQRAQSQFYEAHALTSEPIDRATVEMHIAITFILPGHPDDSRHWLEQADEKAPVKALELAEETGNVKVMKKRSSKLTLLATGGYGALYLGVKKFKRVRANRAAQQGLRELLPVVGCISALHGASGADPSELPALELIEVETDQYELAEVGESSGN